MSKFVYVSGRHCLDFAGTLLWRRTLRTELLDTVDDLRIWAQEAGLLHDMAPPTSTDVHQAVSVREAIYNAIASAISGVARPADAQIDLLNTLARGPLPTLTLTATGTTRSEGTCANVETCSRASNRPDRVCRSGERERVLEPGLHPAVRRPLPWLLQALVRNGRMREQGQGRGLPAA